jgi:hypothetical protein
VRINRVQGLTFGFGAVLGLKGTRLQLRPSLGYGTSDDRVTGSFAAGWSTGATSLSLAASRRISDFSDLPVIAPVLNSFLSQETAKDHGDYVLLHTVELGLRRRLGGRTAVGLSIGVEESRSVATEASPASGTYRLNPPLGSGSHPFARLSLERASGGIAVRHDLQGRLALEVGEGSDEYIRASVTGRWLANLVGSDLLARVYLGVGTTRLPPHRSFVIGGRGTLLGEPFRGFGGRSVGLGHLEWRFDVPAPAIRLGSFASTGRQITLAPFLSAGYTAEPLPGLPWHGTGGIRPVVGVALEWFMRLVRVEAGIGLRDGGMGVTVDINRDWWGLL